MIKKINPHFAPILLLLGMVAGLFFASAHPVTGQETTLRLEPDTLELAPGDEGTLEIRVENVEQLAGVELHLTFDPVLLEVTDQNAAEDGVQIAHGDFLSPDFVAQNITQVDEGVIDYAIACMPVDKAVNGSGTLARVTFRALSEGETIVDIRGFLLADPEGQTIEAMTESSLVIVSRGGPSTTVWALIGVVAVIVLSGFVAVMWRAVKAR
jgi:hypothetical protein